MTPQEIKNERMRVLKGKEIKEVDKKVEKNMIKLTILKKLLKTSRNTRKKLRHERIEKWSEKTSRLVT
jgi:hypothetical protein